jgi:hypothetical protein
VSEAALSYEYHFVSVITGDLGDGLLFSTSSGGRKQCVNPPVEGITPSKFPGLNFAQSLVDLRSCNTIQAGENDGNILS